MARAAILPSVWLTWSSTRCSTSPTARSTPSSGASPRASDPAPAFLQDFPAADDDPDPVTPEDAAFREVGQSDPRRQDAWSALGLPEFDTGEIAARREQFFLDFEAAGSGVRFALTLVVEVAPRHRGRRVVARRQPDLGDRGQEQIIRSTGAAHLRRHPARLKGVGEHVRQ